MYDTQKKKWNKFYWRQKMFEKQITVMKIKCKSNENLNFCKNLNENYQDISIKDKVEEERTLSLLTIKMEKTV